MILDIDNACYGTLSLDSMDDEVSKDTYFVNGDTADSVSFKIGYEVLLSSGKKVGKLYSGVVQSVDVDSGTISVDGNDLKVSNFEYFARVGHYS